MNVLLIYKVRLQTYIYKVVRLVHLLAALATATHEGLLQITLKHPERFHALEEFIAFLGRYRHEG